MAVLKRENSTMRSGFNKSPPAGPPGHRKPLIQRARGANKVAAQEWLALSASLCIQFMQARAPPPSLFRAATPKPISKTASTGFAEAIQPASLHVAKHLQYSKSPAAGKAFFEVRTLQARHSIENRAA